MADIEKLQELIDSSNKIVFFGGAGVSTESGIPDFRSPDGLYAQKYGDVPPEEMISRSYFDRHPEQFFAFYFDRMIARDAQPNRAHRKLAGLGAQAFGWEGAAIIRENLALLIAVQHQHDIEFLAFGCASQDAVEMPSMEREELASVKSRPVLAAV